MAVIAKESKDFEQCPTGAIQSVLAYVNDIGRQRTEWKGEVKIVHQVVLSFEMNERMLDGRRFMLSKFFTMSLGEKANLTKAAAALRNKPLTEQEREEGLDLETLIGCNCLSTVIDTQTGKRRIDSLTPLPKGMATMAIELPEMSEKFQAWMDRLRKEAVPDDAPDFLRQAMNADDAF